MSIVVYYKYLFEKNNTHSVGGMICQKKKQSKKQYIYGNMMIRKTFSSKKIKILLMTAT